MKQHNSPPDDWGNDDTDFMASAQPGFGTLTAAALNAKVFAPVRFVVPGILPEGLTILAGKPKFGKSYAAIDMVTAVGSGGKAFGVIPCEAGDALYVSMEDGERRLQDRIRQTLAFRNAGIMPERLFLETVAPRIDDGLIDALEGWIAARPAPRLIVLDTLVHIKPVGRGANLYDEDAMALRPLHHLAKRHPGLAVVVVTHTRKLDADDPFETISGTHGLTGMADSLMVMARQSDVVKLFGQGRDLENYEKVIERDAGTGGWRILGDASERAKTGERQAILELLKEAGDTVLTTSVIARETGKKADNVSHLLKRLRDEGLVVSPAYGKWGATPVQTVQSVQSGTDSAGDRSLEFEQFEQNERRDGDGPEMQPMADLAAYEADSFLMADNREAEE